MKKKPLSILIGLHRMVNSIDRQTARITSDYGLTLDQFGVLEALYHKGDLTVGETQASILSSTGTIPVVVKNLEKRGLLIRHRGEEDKRKIFLHLTDEGRALIEQAYPVNEKMIIEEFGIYSDNEIDAFLKLLLKHHDASR